jgi:hypothetical protein
VSTNLKRITDLKAHDLPVPIAKSTLYKYAKAKKYPGLFIRVGGMVFIDLSKTNLLLIEPTTNL